MFIALVALIATNICAYSFSQINEIVKYEKMKNENFNMQMQVINNDMNKLELNMSLQQRIRKFFEFQYQSESEKGQGSDELLNQLPQTLKNEILTQTNTEAIQSIGLFSTFSKDCQKEISEFIKQKFYYPDEIIFQEKEINDKLFFIVSGNVQTCIKIHSSTDCKNNYNGMTLQILKKKDVFGYEGFLFGQKNPYTAKAVKGTMVSYIESDKLMQILENYSLDKQIQQLKKYFYFKLKPNKLKQIQDENKQANQLQSSRQQSNNSYINHCTSCDSTSHSLNSCHIVQLILRYKKDKTTYNQERIQLKRKNMKIHNSKKDRIEIEKQAINFQVSQDDNSIISDICSMLNDEDEDISNELTMMVNNDDEIEDNESQFSDDYENKKEDQLELNNLKRKSLKQTTKKNYQKELIRKSVKELSQNNPKQESNMKIFQDQQKMSTNNLDQIDEGEAEGDEEGEAQKSSRIKQNSQYSQKEEQKNQMNLTLFSDIQVFKGDSLKILTSLDKYENTHLSTPKMSNEKNHSNPQSNYQSEMTSSIPVNQYKQKIPISPLRTNKKSNSQLSKKQMNTSTTSQKDKGLPIELPLQFKQFNKNNFSNTIRGNSNPQIEYENDENCNLIDEENKPQIEQTTQRQSQSFQTKLAQKRRQKQLKTYIETEKTMKAVHGYREKQDQQQNQQSFPSEDVINLSLPSPAKLQIRILQKLNNQQDLYFNNQEQSPIVESKIRRATKKGTHSTNRNLESTEKKKLTFTGLEKSSSIIFKQQSFGQKKVQDIQNNPISSPLIEQQPSSMTRTKFAQNTQAMIQSSPNNHKNSSDYSIRYQYGIQNIDCLITRKMLRIQQQKGIIKEFIIVEDNEIDIDKMHKYQIYFPKGNMNQIIRKIKAIQEKKSNKSKYQNQNNSATKQFGSSKQTKTRPSQQYNNNTKLNSSKLLQTNVNSYTKTSLNALDK